MIQRSICLFATIPTAFIHSFDLFVTSPGAFMLLGAGNRNERINLHGKKKKQPISKGKITHTMVERTLFPPRNKEGIHE